MPTLHLTLENGFFARADKPVKLLKPTHVIGNGWECTIKKNGTIICIASRKYNDGVRSIRYLIHPNGFAELTLKKPGKPVKILKKNFVTPKDAMVSNGMLGLSGGQIDNRYAYFRDDAFQKILKEFGFTGIKFMDPNQEYHTRVAYHNNECARGSIITDGKHTTVSFDSGKTDYWDQIGYSWYEQDITIRVTDATWAIFTQYQDEDNTKSYVRILYTHIRNPIDLKKSLLMNHYVARGIVSEEQIKKLRDLSGKSIENLDDYHKIVYIINQIVPQISSIADETNVEEFIQQNATVKFYVSGPLPDPFGPDFHFFLISDNPKILIAEGDLN